MKFSVATLNTEFGRAIRDHDAISKLGEVDVLLLQETHPQRDQLRQNLESSSDLRLVQAIGKYGLAIAVNREWAISGVSSFLMQRRTKLNMYAAERLGGSVNTAFRLRGRGAIAANIRTPDGLALRVATAHPTIPIKGRARAKQIRKLGAWINEADEDLIIGADMNHWPAARKSDLEFRANTNLQAVDIGKQATWLWSRGKLGGLQKLARAPFDGQLDVVLYRSEKLRQTNQRVVDVGTDHLAIVAEFDSAS